MSELLKQVALDGCGIAGCRNTLSTRNSQRAARCAESGRTGDPDRGLRIPDEYSHESVAERFWRELRELEIVLS